MEEMERISVDKSEAVINNCSATFNVPLYNADDVTMCIKRTLPLRDMLDFVAEVVESCVDMKTYTYIPEAKDFAIRICVLKKYANFDVPANLDKCYQLVYGTSAYNQILEYIDCQQFEDIIKAIDSKIAFVLSAFTATAATRVNEMIDQFIQIINESGNVLEGIDMNALSSILSDVSDDGKVNNDSIASIVSNLALKNKSKSAKSDVKDEIRNVPDDTTIVEKSRV